MRIQSGYAKWSRELWSHVMPFLSSNNSALLLLLCIARVHLNVPHPHTSSQDSGVLKGVLWCQRMGDPSASLSWHCDNYLPVSHTLISATDTHKHQADWALRWVHITHTLSFHSDKLYSLCVMRRKVWQPGRKVHTNMHTRCIFRNASLALNS